MVTFNVPGVFLNHTLKLANLSLLEAGNVLSLRLASLVGHSPEIRKENWCRQPTEYSLGATLGMDNAYT